MIRETKNKRPYLKPQVNEERLDAPAVLLCTTGLQDCASAGIPGCCLSRGQECNAINCGI